MRVPDPERTDLPDGRVRLSYADLDVRGEGATVNAAEAELKRVLRERSQDDDFKPRFKAWLDQFRGVD